MTRASSTRRRARRHSAAVYRRRRLVVLVAGALLVAGIVWLAIAQPWRGLAFGDGDAGGESASPTPSATSTASEAVTPSSTPTTTETPDPTASAAADDAPKPCIASQMLVEAVTDADTYAAGVNPQLSIRLTNGSSTACTLNVGTTTQKLTVTSGDDVWWRSTDCQTEPSDMIVTLSAGQSVVSATPVVWNRTRSTVGTCGTDNRPTAPGGGASYHVAVEIGGIPGASAKQIILY